MAESALPLGLVELSEFPSVLVEQKTSVKHKYRLLTPSGREFLYAKEDCSTANAIFFGPARSINVDIFDASNVEVISLRRPHRLGPDKMEVRVCKQLASIVRQEITFLKPVLSVNDASDRPVMRIKGPIGKSGTCNFDLFDRNKQQIGVIQKKWGGIARELFTGTDSYEIVFPPNLDVRFKASLLGACLFIDFLYYN